MTENVTVSERAARRIGEILKTEPDGTMLRVSVEGGGCFGFQYKFDMEREKAEDDLVIARDGVVVLVDPVSVRYMAGSEIDFVEDLIGASFKVKNPNATASCGCGTSFALYSSAEPLCSSCVGLTRASRLGWHCTHLNEMARDAGVLEERRPSNGYARP